MRAVKSPVDFRPRLVQAPRDEGGLQALLDQFERYPVTCRVLDFFVEDFQLPQSFSIQGAGDRLQSALQIELECVGHKLPAIVATDLLDNPRAVKNADLDT